MSGNAFKDYAVQVHRVDKEAYDSIIRAVSDIFDNYVPIGSSQFFEKGLSVDTLGDVDLAVQLPKQDIKETLQEQENIKALRVFGNTVSTVMDVNQKLYHVDFMTSKNISDEQWIMTGGTKLIKGVMRNVLLCYLARKKSESLSTENKTVKWTIAFPGGIGVGIDGAKPDNRDTDPAVILETLGLIKDVELARTFEGLCKMIVTADYVEGFADYARSQWLYKKQPEVIDSAIDYMQNNA